MKSIQLGTKVSPGLPGVFLIRRVHNLSPPIISLFTISQGWGKWQGKAGGEGRGEGSKEEGQEMP